MIPENQAVHPFKKLGLPDRPLLLAPLAGVSDHPFRRICTRHGADLTYVEMISATALIYDSKRTLDMLRRHPSEAVLGVQVTGRSADDTAKAIEILDKFPFDTIDINMGCPVKKVVKTGCGSAILRDPERVYDTVKKAVNATGKPLSVKIRLGWDRNSLTYTEVAEAAAKGGAAWITVHGRTRADDYSVPVDLEAIGHIKKLVSIPVIGNGNLFTAQDASLMQKASLIDGLMVSRGALGNPWVFDFIKGVATVVTLDDWWQSVRDHLRWQREEYGEKGAAAVCMRKHLLWYARGWPGVKKLREEVNSAESLVHAEQIIESFVARLREEGVTVRDERDDATTEQRFNWDPKYDMDRTLDRGVGEDGLHLLEPQI